jgi:hypothetical protein
MKTMELYYIVRPVGETTSVDFVAGPFSSWDKANSAKREHETLVSDYYILEVMQTTAVMY